MSRPDMALPPVRQPNGLRFFLGTWSGRLILINTIVFLLMVWRSQSIAMPTSEVLLQFGAKDPVLIAQGEFWRFFTPIFVHIGIIHFGFNTMGLYYIGYQLESLLGPVWFLAIYLLSGTIGNVGSAVFNTAVSAGASGSLFGLLGCGFLVEKLVAKRLEAATGQRPKRRIYASMVVTNLIFGLLIPGIDNGAHIGGMISGIILTLIMLSTRPNQLKAQSRPLAVCLVAVTTILTACGGYLATNPAFVASRFASAVTRAKNDEEKFIYLTQALRLEPDDPKLLVSRAKILAMHGELTEASKDLEAAMKHPKGPPEVHEMLSEIEGLGFSKEAEALRTGLPQIQPI